MSIYQKLALSVFCLVPGLACSNSDDPPPQDTCGKSGCFDYSKFDGTTPQISLRQDLLKPHGLLRDSCGFGSTCHGDPERHEGDLYLGLGGDDAGEGTLNEEQVALVYANLVDADSRAAPSIKRVVRGEPQNSFLMMKIDGCFEPIRAECTLPPSESDSHHPCGDQMPQTGGYLCSADRDLIRAWIKQGANDN